MNCARTPRESWPDVAKGIGIILVVIGHVWRGVAEAGLLTNETLFQAVDRGIYLFHMPLFFFVSGWFFPRVMRRGTVQEHISRSALRLLYPMVIWTYLFILVKLIAGGAANDPVSAQDLLRWPLPPYLHLWFLWALFLLQIGGMMLRLIPDRALPLLAISAAVLCLLLIGLAGPFNPLIRQALRGAPFFLAGAGLSAMPRWPHGTKPVLLALALFALIQTVVVPVLPHEGAGVMITLSFALLCVLITVTLARHPVLCAQGGLIRLGQASMTIYLTHTIFAAALRIGLMKAGVTALLPHLLLGVTIGLLMPLALQSRTIPVVLRKLLGFTPWQSGRITNTPPPRRAASRIGLE